MSAKNSSSSVRYQALLQLLRTAEILWNASRVFFSKWDLSPSQFNILNLLSDEPGGLTQIELSRLLITHRSNVTGLVDRLETRGLIERKDSPTDRRAYKVVLTITGQKLLGQILPDYYAAAETIWGSFPPARARQLVADLDQLSGNIEQFTKKRSSSLR